MSHTHTQTDTQHLPLIELSLNPHTVLRGGLITLFPHCTVRAFCTLWDYDWFIVGGSEYFKCVCQISVNSIERGRTERGGRRRRRAGDDDNAHCIRKQFQFSQCNPPTFSALPLPLPLLSALSLLILLLNFGLGRNSLTLGQISWWICQVSKQNCAKNYIFFFAKFANLTFNICLNLHVAHVFYVLWAKIITIGLALGLGLYRGLGLIVCITWWAERIASLYYIPCIHVGWAGRQAGRYYWMGGV